MDSYNDPSFVPSNKRLIKPISEPYPIPCIYCTDKLTSDMVDINENCQTSRIMLLVFCETDDWITNSYCDKSCFSIFLGNVDCCPINENPSPVLSDLPSESPYIAPNIVVTTPPSHNSIAFHSLSPSLSSYTDPSKAPSNKPSRLLSAVPSADHS